MGSFVNDIIEHKPFDVENTIFVAVSKNVAQCKTTLFWAVRSFAGKKICLLHVHHSPVIVSLDDSELEKRESFDVLNQYRLLLDQERVQVDKVWTENENIERGIVGIVAHYNIRWLVMGAAADEFYSKDLAGLKSKKATFVCQHAPISCHIWFTCNGYLIHTREGRNDNSEAEFALPLLQLNPDKGNGRQEHLSLESFTQYHRPLDSGKDDNDDLEELSISYNWQCAVNFMQSSNKVESMPLLIDEGKKNHGQVTESTNHKLEQAIQDVKNSKLKASEEAVKRWKEEDDAMEAKCKVKALETLCVKEISLKKEMEDELARKKQEVEKIIYQVDELREELRGVQEKRSALEGQLTESNCTVKDLEKKIISAVELLISFKAQRDAARMEFENARRDADRQRKIAKMGPMNFCRHGIIELSFAEINEATQDFDPSWKIGEGRYGSVYRGTLRHVLVAIKMLPAYGSQSQINFQNGVEVLSRVRHPHLITLIGTCPESRSLVYEYAINGNLEDCLACENRRRLLPWQTRICIAAEICSALIFLHHNKPCIVHGNLKPSKVLLDANFISKLGDFGVNLLIPQEDRIGYAALTFKKPNPNFNSVYADPEYIETGSLTPESDVYSFGFILLQLLTARPISRKVKDVKCALERGNFRTVLDSSSGEWPIEQAEMLAKLALRCCESNRLNRPDLVSEIWSVLEPMRASCCGSLSSSGSNEQRRIPSHFVCPIFQDVMKDPHIAADGFTYEADAIKGWLKSGHNTSPMTNLKLEHCNCLPNHALHQAILEWRHH